MNEREARDTRQEALLDALHAPLMTAMHQLPGTGCHEDVNAMIDALVEGLDERGLSLVNRESLASYLLTHVGGDSSQPWQAGHNYAMTEAARLVRESWDTIAAPTEEKK